jgi:dTDP-4-dehydrorhamnose reductase
MRVLITGADGQVGTALRSTMPQGVELRAAARRELDITDRDALALTISDWRPDLIINTAAYNAVDAAETDESAAYEINFRAVATLAEICRSQDARLIHLSTDFVFDGQSHRPYAIDDRPSPLSVYGKSKLAGEVAATDVLGAAALVVRSAWIYAAGHRNFVLSMLARMQSGETLRVVEDQVGTPTWALPLAAAIWSAQARELVGLQHWTPSGSASRYDLVVAIQEEALAIGLLDAPVVVVPISSAALESAAERPAYSVLDKSATWAALEDTPPHWRVHLRQMLRQLADQSEADHR